MVTELKKRQFSNGTVDNLRTTALVMQVTIYAVPYSLFIASSHSYYFEIVLNICRSRCLQTLHNLESLVLVFKGISSLPFQYSFMASRLYNSIFYYYSGVYSGEAKQSQLVQLILFLRHIDREIQKTILTIIAQRHIIGVNWSENIWWVCAWNDTICQYSRLISTRLQQSFYMSRKNNITK